MERHCPRCNLPESEMDTCVNRAFGPQFQCPEPAESDPTKTLHISCGPCGKRLIVPLQKVMRGGSSLGRNCGSDVCAATLLLDPPEADAKVPPPLTPEMAPARKAKAPK